MFVIGWGALEGMEVRDGGMRDGVEWERGGNGGGGLDMICHLRRSLSISSSKV